MSKAKRTPLGNPIDPTTDAQQQFNDPYGLSGITGTDPDSQKVKTGADLIEEEEYSKSPVGIVSIFDDEAVDAYATTADAKSDPDGLLHDLLDGSSDRTINDAIPTDVLGELSISGDMPDPESDDDMLLNSHQVGLRLNEDYDNPQPLNTAADVAQAERSRRGG